MSTLSRSFAKIRACRQIAAAAAGVALLAGPAAIASAQPGEFEQILRSPTPGIGKRFGERVVTMGDVDGDAFPDVAVAEPAPYTGPNGAELDYGRVHLYSGRSGAFIRSLYHQENVGFADMTVDSLAPLGDLDGDGAADIAVAAPDAPSDRGGIGLVYIFSGGTGALLRVINGGHLPDLSEAATGIAPAGDVDGDGRTDLLVRAVAHGLDDPDLHEPRIDVYSGATGQLIRSIGEQDGVAIAWTYAGVGDVNDDGHDDIAISHTGGTFQDGRVWVLSGRSNRLIRTWGSPRGPEDDNGFGRAVAGVPDMNRDGHDDVAVYATQAGEDDAYGEVYIFSGRSGRVLRTVHVADESKVIQGATLRAVADQTGDGRSDLLLHRDIHFVTPGQNSGFPIHAGRIAIIDPVRSEIVREVSEGHTYILSADALPDADGDGAGEIVAGLPLFFPRYPDERSGLVVVYRGADEDAAPQQIVSPDPGFEKLFGDEVAAVEDVDGDGLADLAVTEPATYTEGRTIERDFGRVHLYSGSTGAFLRTLTRRDDAGFAGTNHGNLVSMGDVDGDGFGDVAVPAPDIFNSRGSYGRVFIFSGATGGVISTIGTGFLPPETASAQGIAAAGDVDADGTTDLLVYTLTNHLSNPNERQATVSVYSGATGAFIRWIGDEGAITVPFSHERPVFAAAGDVNADGYDDVLIARSPALGQGEPNEGTVWIVSGRSGRHIRTFRSQQPPADVLGAADGWFGMQAVGAGDVNQDGWDDVVVYAPRYGAEPREELYVYSGRSGRVVRTITLDTTAVLNQRITLQAIPDQTGDGRAEVMLVRAVLRPDAQNTGGASGDTTRRLSIIDPGRCRVVREIDGGEEYFDSAAVLSDANGDGEDDIAVGLPGYSPSLDLELSGAARIYR